ncbi:hypothetical protein [Rufibacter sp. LB8]|uniref:hypothetical protein n=1 Tax=Rufibacter sp. LB8 TaxID=2777781 RepID=UPI00178C70B1|nr:hypothetical protein [Rufibacter sp. LB8]
MNRNHQNQGFGHRRNQDEDQYRGAYRQDTDRRDGEYDRLNQRNNFNDNDSRYDYRSRDYYGSDQDRQSGSSNRQPDFGRDPNRQGDRFDNPNVFPGESNNGLRAAARNYGNMGSYGGAQGWGSARNGSHRPDDQGGKWASGHGHDHHREQVNRQVYGAYRDHNSFAEGEREQYDGSGRYGTQGADNTRGWEPSDRAGSNGGVRDIGTRHTSRRNDDSQYEIYDTAQSHYNQGQYSQNLGQGNHLQVGHDQGVYHAYGQQQDDNSSRNQGYRQEGEGRRENSGNMAGSLSWGNDRDFRSEEGQHRRFDPMSGHVRGQGSQPPSREDFSW